MFKSGIQGKALGVISSRRYLKPGARLTLSLFKFMTTHLNRLLRRQRSPRTELWGTSVIWGQEDEKEPAKVTEGVANEAGGKAGEGGVLDATGGERFKEQVTNWVKKS